MTNRRNSTMAIAYLLLAISLPSIPGCSRPAFLVGIGTGGRYSEAREEISRRRGGNVDKAILNLETVVREDPTYKDSLTLLGRAYYIKGRYGDARLILQRALAVNNEDEIAWMVLGITQLRLGENDKGLETLRGWLTLFSKNSVESYRGYTYWDRAGRAFFTAQKGLDEKENLMRSAENLLTAIDEEEWNLGLEKQIDRYGL